jgi:hypothetical protein
MDTIPRRLEAKALVNSRQYISSCRLADRLVAHAGKDGRGRQEAAHEIQTFVAREGDCPRRQGRRCGRSLERSGSPSMRRAVPVKRLFPAFSIVGAKR